MTDDVLLNKASMLERCLSRIDEEYTGHEPELLTDYRRQDSIVLNLQRVCETAIDMAIHVTRKKRLGLPQDARDAFTLLETAGLVSPDIATRMRAMVGFRNVAVHRYQDLSMTVVRSILEHHLDDFRQFVRWLIQR